MKFPNAFIHFKKKYDANKQDYKKTLKRKHDFYKYDKKKK